LSSSSSHSTNLALHQFKSKVDFDTNSSSQADVLNESFSNSINSELSKDSTQISFIPVDIHEVRDAKKSFKKLCKACVPSAISNEINSESNHHSNGGTKSNGKSSSNLINFGLLTVNQSNTTTANNKKCNPNFFSFFNS